MKTEEFQVGVQFKYLGVGSNTQFDTERNVIQTVIEISRYGTILTDLLPDEDSGIGPKSIYAKNCQLISNSNILDSYYLIL